MPIYNRGSLFHYFTGLTWDAGLKFTGVELDLVQDSEMYMFLELAMRGGVSTVTKRKLTSNTPEIPDTYDPDQPIVWIIYLDANNLVIYLLRGGGKVIKVGKVISR